MLFQRWAQIRSSSALQANLCKFSQDAQLRKMLESTGERPLVETSRHDCIWAAGVSRPDQCSDRLRWRGANVLGSVLEETRRILRENPQTTFM